MKPENLRHALSGALVLLAMFLLGVAAPEHDRARAWVAQEEVDERPAEDAEGGQRGMPVQVQADEQDAEAEHGDADDGECPGRYDHLLGPRETGVDYQRRTTCATETLSRIGVWQTAVLAGTLVLLWRTLVATRGMLRLTRETLSEVEEATAAAQETVGIAQSSDAAYVFTRFDLSRGARSRNPDVIVEVSVENVGRTPARDVIVSVIAIDDTGEETEARIVCREKRIGAIGSGQKPPIGKVAFSPVNAANAGKAGPAFTLLTRVSYSTVFGGDESVVTQEGAYFDVAVGPPSGGDSFRYSEDMHIDLAVYDNELDLRETLRRYDEEQERKG